MDDRAGHHVQAHAGDRGAGIDPGLLHEADVERHAADVGGGDPVDERRGELGHHRRDERQALGHATCHPDRGGHIGQPGHHDAHGHPCPVGRLHRPHAVVDVGELREKQVEGAGQDGHRHERPGPDAHEPLERRDLLARHLGGAGAELGQEPLRHLVSGRGRQRQGLEVRERGRQVLGVEHACGRRQGSLRSDERGEGREQLRPVDGLRSGRRRLLAEAEVDDRRPAGRHQDVARPQRAMREPGPVDGRNLSPDRVEQRIVDLVGRQGVEQLAVDAFERQRDGAVARAGPVPPPPDSARPHGGRASAAGPGAPHRGRVRSTAARRPDPATSRCGSCDRADRRLSRPGRRP